MDTLKRGATTLTITTLSITTLCHYAECRFAESHILFFAVVNVIVQCFIMLAVTMANVCYAECRGAPKGCHTNGRLQVLTAHSRLE